LNKERNLLGAFIFNTLPKMKELFSLTKVSKNSTKLFDNEEFVKGKEIQKIGERSDKLYILKEG
jgi:hypothetical protein